MSVRSWFSLTMPPPPQLNQTVVVYLNSYLSLSTVGSVMVRDIMAMRYMWSDTLSGFSTFLYTQPVRGTLCGLHQPQQMSHQRKNLPKHTPLLTRFLLFDECNRKALHRAFQVMFKLVHSLNPLTG